MSNAKTVPFRVFFYILQVNSEACHKALSEEMLSTDIAYYLVKKGVSLVNASCNIKMETTTRAHSVIAAKLKKYRSLNCVISLCWYSNRSCSSTVLNDGIRCKP